jgi:hypothetical protein
MAMRVSRGNCGVSRRISLGLPVLASVDRALDCDYALEDTFENQGLSGWQDGHHHSYNSP